MFFFSFECFSSDHSSTELCIIAHCLSCMYFFSVSQIRHYYYLPFFFNLAFFCFYPGTNFFSPERYFKNSFNEDLLLVNCLNFGYSINIFKDSFIGLQFKIDSYFVSALWKYPSLLASIVVILSQLSVEMSFLFG